MLLKKRVPLSAELLLDLKKYIDQSYSAPDGNSGMILGDRAEMFSAPNQAPRSRAVMHRSLQKSAPKAVEKRAADYPMPCCEAAPDSLNDALNSIDEGFSSMLMRKIDEKQMTDAQCYKKAQIDRKLFSKIRSQRDYRPSKQTAISFALALELSLDETKDLLGRAGYALSPSSRFDLIIEYFIGQEVYDTYTINLALFEHKQPLLGE